MTSEEFKARLGYRQWSNERKGEKQEYKVSADI
jgi:hypothetical protein